MKNLKKLSVAVMLAALFSTSFTSCIDGEVDPVVEAIYAAQADLLAAQAGVQDAEAAFLLAQANAEDALATYREAQAEQALALAATYQADADATDAQTAANIAEWEEELRALMAANADAEATALLDLQEAQALFEITMAGLIADLEEAGAIVAAEYATLYATYMGKVGTSATAILTLEGTLAEKKLLLDATDLVTWEFYLEGLEADLAAKQALVVAKQAEIAGYQEAMDNPTAREAQYAQIVEDVAALDAEQADLVIQIAEAENVRLAAVAEKADAVAFMVSPTGPYAVAKAGVATWTAAYTADTTAITTQTAIIAGLTTTIADYAGTTSTLTAAVTAATARIGAAEDNNHPSGHAPGFGLLGDIEVIENTVGTVVTPAPITGNTAIDMTDNAPITSLTLYEVLWNAQLAAVETAKDVADMEADFADQVATYNAAAIALANATDPAGALATLVAAQLVETNATTALGVAQTAYLAAQAAFVADPSGSVDTDGAALAVTDLGEIGIHSDDPGVTTTYMEVATWSQPDLLTDEFFPGSFTGIKYTPTTLAARVTALKLATTNNDTVENGEWEVPADGDYVLWLQDGTTTNAAGGAQALPAGGTFLTAAEVVDAQSSTSAGEGDIEKVYFVEVESDDTSVDNVDTFNIATNKLVTDDFASKWFTSDGDPKDLGNTWESVLAFGDDDAGYEVGWDGTGAMGAADTLTAQAVLWNAKLAVEMAQYDHTVATGALAVLQDAFDVEQELFDDGLANIAALQVLDDTADDAVDDAGDDVSDANDAKALLVDELGTEYLTTSGNRELNNGELTLTWDEHANDGLAIGDEIFEHLASAEWDSTDDGDADSLTAYAELWNAQEALAIHSATSLAGYNTQLATATTALNDATLEAAEDLIMRADFQGEMDALQAQYDALLLTPLYAALVVAIDDATDAKAALEADKTASEAMETALLAVKTALGAQANYASLITTAEGQLVTALENVEKAEVLIAKGEVDLQDCLDAIADLEAQIAVLEAQMAVDQAIVDEYKALLDAALAS